jgi:protoheme IX farnesyltransferase
MPIDLPAYLDLTKFRLSSLVLITTAVGYWLGMRPGDSLVRLLATCAGTALVVGGANALNQWLEQEPDAQMRRTRMRPLPTHRLQPRQALFFGALLSGLGVVVIGGAANALAVAVAILSWVCYVLIYTPLKRRTPFSTLVGAVPGALPPVIGWAASHGTLDLEAWALFLIIFIWQLPHFLAIAVVHRADYARAGFPVLPVLEPEGLITARQTLLYGLVLLPVSVFPTVLGMVGPWYFLGAALLSAAFLGSVLIAVWQHSIGGCRQLFRASIIYLPLLFALLVIDRAWWRPL